MEIARLGSRGVVVTFNDPYMTNTYIVNSINQIFICDTFCGPDSMRLVRNYLERGDARNKQIVVFNSHYHYDHIWGNCEFKEESIYAHSSSLEKIEEHGENDLRVYVEHMKGKVELTPPNQLFSSNMSFDDGRINLFHSPGHTADSSSLIDHIDLVLFVGDNVESPFPFIFDLDIDQYIATLVEYLSLEWKYLVAGHDPVITDNKLIDSNIEYLENLRDWNVDLMSIDGEKRGNHLMNLAFLSRGLDVNDIDGNMKAKMSEAIDFLNIMESREKVEWLREAFRPFLS